MRVRLIFEILYLIGAQGKQNKEIKESENLVRVVGREKQ